MRRDRRVERVVAGVVFVLSLPAMYELGVFAIFAYGFGLWVVPWLLAVFTGVALLPQGALGGAIASEFDGPIIAFAFWASVQNALMAWVLARMTIRSTRVAEAQERSDDR